MIFGRWTPLGSLAAALLFGFSLELALRAADRQLRHAAAHHERPRLYVATIVAVAGLVGKVRAPAADGQPYVKS